MTEKGPYHCKYVKGRCQEDEARLFSVAPGDRTRSNTETQGVSPEYEKKLLHCEGD